MVTIYIVFADDAKSIKPLTEENDATKITTLFVIMMQKTRKVAVCRKKKFSMFRIRLFHSIIGK